MAVETVVTPVHRLSLDQYHRMIEAGVFAEDDKRIEFIEGVLVDMSPRSPEHDDVIAWLADRLADHIDRNRFQIRVQSALTLERSEPEPDLYVWERNTPRTHHPSTAALVVEVAVSSQQRDLLVKPPLYARAGVGEYWVVDLDARQVVVHRHPAGGVYQRVETVQGGSLTAAPLDVTIDVAQLLAP